MNWFLLAMVFFITAPLLIAVVLGLVLSGKEEYRCYDDSKNGYGGRF